MRILNRHCEPPPFNVGDIVQVDRGIRYRVLDVRFEVPIWRTTEERDNGHVPRWVVDVCLLSSPMLRYSGYSALFFIRSESDEDT